MYKLFKLIFRNKIISDFKNWLYNQGCDIETLLWAKELHDGTYESLSYRDSIIIELVNKLNAMN